MDNRRSWCRKKNNVLYVNENFFSNWSSSMAYVLGFFAADGTLTFNRKRRNYYVEFASADCEILNKIRKILESGHKISTRKKGKTNPNETFRLQIGSKKIYQNLMKIGFKPNKSLSMDFPSVPVKYLSHFIRGYFDGDGYSTYGQYKRKNRINPAKIICSGFVSGSKNFLEKLRQLLNRYASLKGGTLYFYARGYRLVYSVRDSRRLFNFMFNNSGTLYLKRKKLSFQNAITNMDW